MLQHTGVVSSGVHQASDLVAGEYEGGYKVWECSVDLSRYIAQHRSRMSNKRIIELGCGQGLAGITAMMCGGEVHFQDYDTDVIESLTIPVVLKNVERMKDVCGTQSVTPRFFSGDWGTLGEVLEGQCLSGTYDVVLTSETIYSLESMPRLLRCIKKVRDFVDTCLICSHSRAPYTIVKNM